MIDTADSIKKKSRVLILSLRNIRDFIYNACLFEFEDYICNIDEVDLITPSQSNLTSKIIEKSAKAAIRTSKSKIPESFYQINPLLEAWDLNQNYDLFFVILDDCTSFLKINFIQKWREKCNKAICYIAESWNYELEKQKYYFKFFQDFDLIFSGINHTTEELAQLIDRPCKYLPVGVDAASFYPDKPYSQRAVDVYNIGRRSPITHEALLKFAQQKNKNYDYDLYKSSQSNSPGNREQLRKRTATRIKNSRYFIANYAKANLPNTKYQEIPYRYFEGAAGGTVLIGCPPDTAVFKQYFDWQDCIIPIPVDAPNIGEVIAELNSQPERLARISRDNVVNSLLKHDWVYRWQEILAAANLEPSSKILSRKAYLQKLALSINE